MKKLITLFLKLGVIGFGGPAAHIAMMRQEVVIRKKWMTDEEFLHLIAVTNLIPGPNSTEMSIIIGKKQRGLKGLLFSGLAFIVPAVIITYIISVLYVRYGSLPSVQPFLLGIKPAIIAIIISAVLPLAKSSFRSPVLIIIGITAFILSLLGVHEILIMAGGGLLMIMLHFACKNNILLSVAALPLSKLFFIFFKIGAILYGSGYVLFAFLETELVDTNLITSQQLADAIAVGQMTPGPLFSSVTFIGYILNGWQGAFIATLGVFLPAFIFIALLDRLFARFSASAVFRAFLNGVIAASVALIASTGITLGVDAVTDWQTALIFVAALVVTFFFKSVNSAFIVVGGAFTGYLLYLV